MLPAHPRCLCGGCDAVTVGHAVADGHADADCDTNVFRWRCTHHWSSCEPNAVSHCCTVQPATRTRVWRRVDWPAVVRQRLLLLGCGVLWHHHRVLLQRRRLPKRVRHMRRTGCVAAAAAQSVWAAFARQRIVPAISVLFTRRVRGIA